ncbi:MAG: organic solvent tolerance protein OstA [Selenomonadaceae bacterium]|nr:organic solvent tolerance protein OstA [Selenomonadaceae bacterium]
MLLGLGLSGGTAYSAEEKTPAELNADTVEYDMTTGDIAAEGDVLMKYGEARLAGQKASYNLKTEKGKVEGNVIAMRDKLRVTADLLTVDGREHFTAQGNVHGTEEDKEFLGQLIDYYPQQRGYVKIPGGGIVKNKDGTFTADSMEGWLEDEYYIGDGHAHLVSPPRDLEAGGDRVDYYGKEQSKAVLQGNAWAVQENNTLRSNRLTIYLDNERDKLKVEPSEK